MMFSVLFLVEEFGYYENDGGNKQQWPHHNVNLFWFLLYRAILLVETTVPDWEGYRGQD